MSTQASLEGRADALRRLQELNASQEASGGGKQEGPQLDEKLIEALETLPEDRDPTQIDTIVRQISKVGDEFSVFKTVSEVLPSILTPCSPPPFNQSHAGSSRRAIARTDPARSNALCPAAP